MPNTSVCTTYAVPSDSELGHGSSVSDELARAKRVQQQVQQRLAEKTTHLTRLNAPLYSEYDGVSTVRYHSLSPGFTSSSVAHNGSRPLPAARASQYSGGFSSRSAVEMGTQRRISLATAMSGRGGRPLQSRDDSRLGLYPLGSRAASRAEHDGAAPGLVQPPPPSVAGSWLARENKTMERHSAFQGGSLPNPAPMRRTLSGTLARDGTVRPWQEAELVHQYAFKGPSHRTISRINNRQQQYHHMHQQQQRMNSSSTQWQQMSNAGSVFGGGGGGPCQTAVRRAASQHSLRSVGKGVDVGDGAADGSTGSDTLGRMQSLDMPTAVSYLSMMDSGMQVLGAAYIQHQCYHSSDAKSLVRQLKGIPALVLLFNSENQEVQRYATGATRNLIYESMDNKTALIEAGGISQLMEALREPDDELRKNITGILWNLSSKDSLKEKLAKEVLGELTDCVLVPLSGEGDAAVIQQSPSEADIFYNTTGCLRNLSSVSGRTRQQMREKRGLVDALVGYINNALQEGKANDKGVENCVCVLRNLSYQLYSEIPPSVQLRLEGPTRGQDTHHSDAIGCFTPQSKKAKEQRNQELATLSEVARQPKDAEWLWHPQVVALYGQVLRNCEGNTGTREAAAGAMQNITAGDARWASVLSRVALEQERLLPVVLDLMRVPGEQELRSLTGLLRNLSRHSRNKADMATKVVNILVTKLPSDGLQKDPSTEVVVNICGTLNNLVMASSVAARDITFFDGLPKLVGIKTTHDNSPGKLRAAKAASTVLCNMFHYNKLHRDYKQKGFVRQDFTDATM